VRCPCLDAIGNGDLGGNVVRERFQSLGPREREIMIQVVRGRLSKQIAGDMGITEATVKVHRSRLMHKIKARSLPELSRMADKLNSFSYVPLYCVDGPAARL